MDCTTTDNERTKLWWWAGASRGYRVAGRCVLASSRIYQAENNRPLTRSTSAASLHHPEPVPFSPLTRTSLLFTPAGGTACKQYVVQLPLSLHCVLLGHRTEATHVLAVHPPRSVSSQRRGVKGPTEAPKHGGIQARVRVGLLTQLFAPVDVLCQLVSPPTVDCPKPINAPPTPD